MFLHYYLQKGFTLEYLNNISIADKDFMLASMIYEIEKESEKWEKLSV